MTTSIYTKNADGTLSEVASSGNHRLFVKTAAGTYEEISLGSSTDESSDFWCDADAAGFTSSETRPAFLRFMSSFDGLTEHTTDLSYLFSELETLTQVPAFDTSKATNMKSMFSGCKALTTVPELDTSQVTNMDSMFFNCRALVSVPELNTAKVTTMKFMFGYNSALTTVPELDTSQVTNMDSMFSGCSSLTSVPLLDTSKVVFISDMFRNCASLESIPAFDFSSVTPYDDTIYFLYGCTALKSIRFKNLRAPFSLTSCTNLEHDALVEVIENLATVTTSPTLKLGSTLRAKLSTDEIAVATNKGWKVS